MLSPGLAVCATPWPFGTGPLFPAGDNDRGVKTAGVEVDCFGTIPADAYEFW